MRKRSDNFAINGSSKHALANNGTCVQRDNGGDESSIIQDNTLIYIVYLLWQISDINLGE